MKLRWTILAILALTLSACSGPGYYLQAVSGHLKLMRSREDVEALLQDPRTPAELAEQLKTAQRIKAFAQDTLGLPSGDSYSSYAEVEGDALLWNVVATGEFSLQPKNWCFPVAGCLPYRGFFKRQKALHSAAKLRDKGMDVIVSEAAAYSSLGWFGDPLLSTMVKGPDVRLAAYLFHELAHQRVYVRNDGVFNEAYATFVERAGVRAWLESQGRAGALRDWQDRQKAAADLGELLAGVRRKLTAVYRSEQPDAVKRRLKAGILDGLVNRREELIAGKWQGKRYFDAWFEDPPNNASLALYNTYESGQCAFGSLLEEARGNMENFHELARQKSRLDKQERSKWLNQSCESVARHGNL